MCLFIKSPSLIGSRDDALVLHENSVHCFLNVTGPAMYCSAFIKLLFVLVNNAVCKVVVHADLDLTVASRV